MREKYFILLEGSDRAILRTSVSAASTEKESFRKVQSGKKGAHFCSEEKDCIKKEPGKRYTQTQFFPHQNI